jgi:uncharacterized Fe-S cluster-containing radical SAM superfamily protein
MLSAQVYEEGCVRTIDTDAISSVLRERMIDTSARAISLTNFHRSEQSEDLTHPPNAEGFGRIHRFELEAFDDWPSNPLPIEPALRALGLGEQAHLDAQIFQSSGCNWRCWYCFVPFKDLSANRGELVAVADMVDWDLAAHAQPHAVDLTGGQPDLTPEWTVWYLEELERRGADEVYVWSDDNLSTDYLWRFLSDEQRDYLGGHPRYGRACCIKGYDQQSFAFNTLAAPELFERQFALLDRLQRTTAIDYYVYLTITTPTTDDLGSAMGSLLDRLMKVHEYLPLRCVPLKVLEWGPVTPRLKPPQRTALENQMAAVAAWEAELEVRFPGARPDICDVPR